MRPYILSETNYKAVKKEDFQLAILPWGATEAHNYHLPYGTDNIETEKITAEAARIAWEAGARIIVLPVVPFGVNTGQKDIALDLNMNPSTQLAVLHDIVEVLHHQGIYKLLIMNGHGGNDFKPLIREMGYRFPKMYISLCSWYLVLNQLDYFEIHQMGNIHTDSHFATSYHVGNPGHVKTIKRTEHFGSIEKPDYALLYAVKGVNFINIVYDPVVLSG